MATNLILTDSAPPVSISDSAAAKVWQLIHEEGNLDLMLRAYITGGGCSGLEYHFAFSEKIEEDDMVIDKTTYLALTDCELKPVTIKLLVDAASFLYLKGAQIDYKKDLKGEEFIIRNLNAKTACSCGKSFSD